MTGRFEIDKPKVELEVYKLFKFRFSALDNKDAQPGDELSCLRRHHGEFVSQTCAWGIHPVWAHHMIFNAHAETITQKKTFSSAYTLNRCILPCTGWFEWSGEPGHKIKHKFSHKDDSILFIAGILFPDHHSSYQLVTLTCEADINCGIYHHRMPLIIKPEKVHDWLELPHTEAELLKFHDLHPISIEPPI